MQLYICLTKSINYIVIPTAKYIHVHRNNKAYLYELFLAKPMQTEHKISYLLRLIRLSKLYSLMLTKINLS